MAIFEFTATPTGTQKTRIGNAFATNFAQGATLTNVQKEALVMSALKDYAMSIVRAVEAEAAAAAARQSSIDNITADLGGV